MKDKGIEKYIFSQNRIKAQSGFTLVEVMIAISILTVGLLGVATMQMSAIRGNGFSNDTTTALALAEEKMEQLLSLSYTDAELAASTTHEEEINASGEIVTGGFYHRSWVVSDFTSPNPNYKEITMTVTWDSDRHQVSLVCLRRE